MQEQKELAFSFTMIVCRHGCHYCFSASVIIGGSHQKENAFVFLGINGMNDLGKWENSSVANIGVNDFKKIEILCRKNGSRAEGEPEFGKGVLAPNYVRPKNNIK